MLSMQRRNFLQKTFGSLIAMSALPCKETVGKEVRELRIPILTYHRVHADDDQTMPPVKPDQYCGHVTRSDFRRQVQFLADRGFQTITHQDLIRWFDKSATLPPRPVLVDFDDNRLNVFQNAWPILRDRGYRATVFVITTLADGGYIYGPHDFPAMKWKELEELAKAGWTMGAHTRHHFRLTDMLGERQVENYRDQAGNPQQRSIPQGETSIMDELAGAQEDIRRHLGVKPETFAYPVGSWNEQLEGMVKRLYRSARLWQETGPWQYVTRITSPYRLVGVNISAKMTFEDFRKGAEDSGV